VLKAIVTGAAGFAGAHLTRALAQRGFAVYAIVRPGSLHNRRLSVLESVKQIECDLNDLHLLPEKIGEPCDCFFHLAWTGEANAFAAQYANVNISLVALKVAAGLSCKRFVATGSQAEYGLQTELITEDTLPAPFTPYGAAKMATMHLTKSLAAELGVEWIWGRIFSLYGEFEPHGRMLPDLVSALRAGKDFALTAATQNWDYLLANEAADALIALMERGRDGEVYNIAHGAYRPLKTFTEEMRNYFAPESNISYGKSNALAVSLQPSVAKIQRDTGWQAQISFMDGIRRTYG